MLDKEEYTKITNTVVELFKEGQRDTEIAKQTKSTPAKIKMARYFLGLKYSKGAKNIFETEKKISKKNNGAHYITAFMIPKEINLKTEHNYVMTAEQTGQMQFLIKIKKV
jgi:hypothetical protein